MKQPAQLFFALCLFTVFVFSCKDKKTEEVNATTPPPPPPPQEINIPYPALGNAYISKLYAETKKVDIIFYDLPISVNGSFTFATALIDGTGYAVTVKTQPADPIQICSITNGSGTVAGVDVTNVSVICVDEVIFSNGFE